MNAWKFRRGPVVINGLFLQGITNVRVNRFIAVIFPNRTFGNMIVVDQSAATKTFIQDNTFASDLFFIFEYSEKITLEAHRRQLTTSGMINILQSVIGFVIRKMISFA